MNVLSMKMYLRMLKGWMKYMSTISLLCINNIINSISRE